MAYTGTMGKTNNNPGIHKIQLAPGTGRNAQVEQAVAFSSLLTEFGRLLSGEYDRRMPLARGPSMVLSLLAEKDARTQTELAEEIGLHKVSIGTHVDELVRHNLVERRPHPTDRRSKLICLTDHYHRVKHFGESVFAMIHARAREGISDEDYAKAVEVLAAMRDNLRRLKQESGS